MHNRLNQQQQQKNDQNQNHIDQQNASSKNNESSKDKNKNKGINIDKSNQMIPHFNININEMKSNQKQDQLQLELQLYNTRQLEDILNQECEGAKQKHMKEQDPEEKNVNKGKYKQKLKQKLKIIQQNKDLFARTDSVYQQEQPQPKYPNPLSNPSPNPNPSQQSLHPGSFVSTLPALRVNKYRQALHHCQRFKGTLKLGLLLHFLRFLFMVAVYWKMEIFLPQVLRAGGRTLGSVQAYSSDYSTQGYKTNRFLNEKQYAIENETKLNQTEKTNNQPAHQQTSQDYYSKQYQQPAQKNTTQYQQVQPQKPIDPNQAKQPPAAPIPQQTFQPWNIMVYFLSSSIDVISIIGYISTIKFLKSQMKILGKKMGKQDKIIQREKRQQQRVARRKNGEMVEEEELEIQQVEQQPQAGPQPPQNQLRLFMHARNSSLATSSRAQLVYMSFYSLIRQYKYRNRDYSAPFKIAKTMHLFTTFMIFGTMALIQQRQTQQKIYKNLSQDTQTPTLPIYLSIVIKQLTLWLFLYLAYFSTYQMDYHSLEQSSGPYLKVEKFHITKISQIYGKFMGWRRAYGRVLAVGVLGMIAGVVWALFTWGHGDWVGLGVRVGVLVALGIMFWGNRIIVKSSNLYLNKMIQNEYNISSQRKLYNVNQNGQKLSAGQVQRLQIHKNLTLQGLYHKFSIYQPFQNQSQTQVVQYLTQNSLQIAPGQLQHANKVPSATNKFVQHTQKEEQIQNKNQMAVQLIQKKNQQSLPSFFRYSPTIYRSLIFMYVLSFLRQLHFNDDSQLQGQGKSKFWVILSDFILICVLIGGQIYKFKVSTSSQINLLNTCKYQQLSTLRFPTTLPRKSSPNTLPTSTCCSVCLVDYTPAQNVTILCCGHIFHTLCLFDWLKQKKECPLCRLNIEEYYQGRNF